MATCSREKPEPPLIEDGLRLEVNPAPLTLRFTVPVKPPRDDTETVYMMLNPAVTVCYDGLTLNVNFGA